MRSSWLSRLLPALCCLWLAGCDPAREASPPTPPAADHVFVNGKLYLADAAQNFARAMAVRGTDIVAVGSDEAIRSYIGDATTVHDLEGRLVIPGLIDSHIHPAGIIRYDHCNLDSQAMSLEALSVFVGDCVERLDVAPDAWLAVSQWNFSENNRPSGSLRNLREALDAASVEHPIILLGNDGHHYATNSAGLARARNESGERVGLSAATLATDFAALRPFVGVDRSGEPNGAVNEGVPKILDAPWILDGDIPALIPHVGQIPQRLNEEGITSIQEAAYSPALAPLYDALLDRGPLTLRIHLAQLYPPEDFMNADGTLDTESLIATASKVRDRYADVPNIEANRLKYFVDGVLEGDILADPPTLPNGAQIADYYLPRFHIDMAHGEISLLGYYEDVDTGNGLLSFPDSVTRAFVAAADAAGFAVHLHAIGDRAVRSAVDAIEAVTPPDVTTNRHSIAHLQLVAPEEVARLGRLKIPLAFTFAWAVRAYEYDLTVIPFIEKLSSLDALYDDSYYYRQVYPAESILEAGGVIAAGSDAPVEVDDARPFHNIEMAVTRDGGEGPLNAAERLDILDAIDAYTINGARLLDQADLTGSLETGKRADFAILDRDIVELDRHGLAGAIGDTQVLETWFDGKPVYRRSAENSPGDGEQP